MTGIIIALLIIITFIISTIFARKIVENFNTRSELPQDIHTNVRGMLVELQDKGLDISLNNKSYEGRYSVKITSKKHLFKYNEVSDYVLQLKDYMKHLNYNKANVSYYTLTSREDISHDLIAYFAYSDDNIESIPNVDIDSLLITFNIKISFLEKILIEELNMK